MNNIKNKMAELYGEPEQQGGYSGLFIGIVYDSFNQRNRDAFPESSELSNHLHQNWHEIPVTSSKYGYQHRDEGITTVLDFFLERKMPCPPDFQFEFENKTYKMKFKYSAPQDGKKSSGKKSTGKKSSGKKSTGKKSTGKKSTGKKSTGKKSTGKKSSKKSGKGCKK